MEWLQRNVQLFWLPPDCLEDSFPQFRRKSRVEKKSGGEKGSVVTSAGTATAEGGKTTTGTSTGAATTTETVTTYGQDTSTGGAVNVLASAAKTVATGYLVAKILVPVAVVVGACVIVASTR